MSKKSTPYEIAPHEIGFLILLGVAMYLSSPFQGAKLVPALIYSAALITAIPVLIWRCREEWRQLPNQWFFLLLSAAWVVLFVCLGNTAVSYLDSPSLMMWMFGVYTAVGTDDGHGLLIPFVVLVLFWWKRKELVAQPARLWWPAIGLIAVALALHILGFKSQLQRISVAAFFLGLYGLTGLAWGWHWLKTSFFPFFLLVFCIPVAEFADPLTMPLRLLVSRIVEIIAHLGLSPDLIREGTQLFDAQHTFAYEVAAACSGIHSLVALLALTTIYGFVVFRSYWKRAVMVGIALPLAVLGNVLRLCFTIVVAETFGQKAGKAVETKAGFVTFLVPLVCIYLVARWLDRAEKKADQPKTPGSPTLADKPVAP